MIRGQEQMLLQGETEKDGFFILRKIVWMGGDGWRAFCKGV